ncbi:hypothetical protein L6452_17396 [Arctium lappa]|uniref:Uncharacterized protein n=1 Tax=Arctium lappa TaxID=4217 RepID=A0ACB9C3H4_ARCLA|nr:hypothetical protein L6452_17396 [Arctium lappa]
MECNLTRPVIHSKINSQLDLSRPLLVCWLLHTVFQSLVPKSHTSNPRLELDCSFNITTLDLSSIELTIILDSHLFLNSSI